MAEFFNISNPNLYIAIFLALTNSVLLSFTGYKFLQILQLSGYRVFGYNAWLKKTRFTGRYMSRIFMLAFLSFACMLVFINVFDSIDTTQYASYAGIGFYALFSSVFIKHMYRAPKKTPLKTTHRMNRLIGCLAVINAIATFAIVSFSTIYIPHVRYTLIAITPILLAIFVPLAHFVMLPFEKLKNLKFLKPNNQQLNHLKWHLFLVQNQVVP